MRAGELTGPGDVRAAIEALEAHLASAELTPDPAERARLAILLDDLRSRVPKKRRGPSIAAAAVFILCFVTSAILVWKKVDRAEIDARLDATAVRFVPATPLYSLLRSLQVTEIAPGDGATLQQEPASPGMSIRRLSCSGCTLQGLDLTNVKTIELRHLPNVAGIAVAAAGGELSMEVVAEGKVQIEYDDEARPPETLTLDDARIFTVDGNAAGLKFTVHTKPEDRILLEPLAVSAIAFDEEIDRKSEGRAVPVEQSSIRKGSLHLRRVDRATALVRGDRVDFHGFAGRLHELLVTPEGLHVALVGRVHDLRVGPERQSLMPSELETLRADSGLAVYWASAMWLAGLLVSILQWFRPH